jgi:hypothetical protein
MEPKATPGEIFRGALEFLFTYDIELMGKFGN